MNEDEISTRSASAGINSNIDNGEMNYSEQKYDKCKEGKDTGDTNSLTIEGISINSEITHESLEDNGKHPDTLRDEKLSERINVLGKSLRRFRWMICLALISLIPLYATIAVLSIELHASKEQDGGWSAWGSWGPCSNSEGTGLRTRIRSCEQPPPSEQGRQCVGDAEQVSICNYLANSIIEGIWTNWGDWDACSSRCDGGIRARTRTCSNSSIFPGIQCVGQKTQSSLCNMHPCEDGDWSVWESWGPCSKTDGIGLQSRTRFCTNPIPSRLGKQCLGNTKEVTICNNQTPSKNKTRYLTKILSVENGGQKGDWTSDEFCPLGTFASGYNMKIGDNSALNSIRLICTGTSGDGRHNIMSSEGSFGSWLFDKSCSKQSTAQNYLVGFSLQVEPDDTGANFVKFRCRDLAGHDMKTELVIPPGQGLWGSYGEWSESCDPNSVICGLRTKIEPDQGLWYDDIGLNDVIFYCCTER